MRFHGKAIVTCAQIFASESQKSLPCGKSRNSRSPRYASSLPGGGTKSLALSRNSNPLNNERLRSSKTQPLSRPFDGRELRVNGHGRLAVYTFALSPPFCLSRWSSPAHEDTLSSSHARYRSTCGKASGTRNQGSELTRRVGKGNQATGHPLRGRRDHRGRKNRRDSSKCWVGGRKI